VHTYLVGPSWVVAFEVIVNGVMCLQELVYKDSAMWLCSVVRDGYCGFAGEYKLYLHFFSVWSGLH